jgi:putative ABC transport system permease protein
VNIVRTVKISLDVLLGHKLRTLLSSGGIAIGVAAVVLMVGAGQAAEQDVVSKVQSMGTNLLVVQAGRFRTFGHRSRQVATYTTMTPRDVERLLHEVPDIARASGYWQGSVVAGWQGVHVQTTLAGAGPSLFDIRGMSASEGRLFTGMEERSLQRVAVVGPTVVQNLFGGGDPIGQVIQVNKVLFRVIGVASPRGQDLSGNDQDDVIYVPLTTAMVRVFHVNYLQSIILQATSASALASLPSEVTPVLRRTHRLRAGQEDDFTYQDQSQLLASEQETSQAFTALVGSVAGVSLFTGGIGILAVMLISIRERTREIGLRRALGARKRDILVQFILEAAALSGLGGLAGIVVGTGGDLLTCRLLHWPLTWPWGATLFAVGLSMAMGILFGLYPSLKAARLEPATALHAAG